MKAAVTWNSLREYSDKHNNTGCPSILTMWILRDILVEFEAQGLQDSELIGIIGILDKFDVKVAFVSLFGGKSDKWSLDIRVIASEILKPYLYIYTDYSSGGKCMNIISEVFDSKLIEKHSPEEKNKLCLDIEALAELYTPELKHWKTDGENGPRRWVSNRGDEDYKDKNKVAYFIRSLKTLASSDEDYFLSFITRYSTEKQWNNIELILRSHLK